MQTEVVQLALDLLVREPDIEGFFGALEKTMVEESESHACARVAASTTTTALRLWMAYVTDRLFTPPKGGRDWADRGAFPCESMADHLFAYTPGGARPSSTGATIRGCPSRCGRSVAAKGVHAVVATPLVLGGRNLGWMALSHVTQIPERRPWWRVVLHRGDRPAGGAGAAPQPRGRAQSPGGAPQGDSRGAQPARARHPRQSRAGLRRDPDAAPGRAARGRRAAAGGRVERRDRRRAGAHASGRSAPFGRHAPSERRQRRRRRDGDQAPRGSRPAHDGVPIDVVVDELPRFGDGVEREIIGIAQEALTNAVRHSRARPHHDPRARRSRSIGLRLSVADDGRGIARERTAPGSA